MKKIFFLLLVSMSAGFCAAMDGADYYVTIAQEAYDSGQYQLAIDKCKGVLAEFPDNPECKGIVKQKYGRIKKSRAGKSSRERKNSGPGYGRTSSKRGKMQTYEM